MLSIAEDNMDTSLFGAAVFAFGLIDFVLGTKMAAVSVTVWDPDSPGRSFPGDLGADGRQVKEHRLEGVGVQQELLRPYRTDWLTFIHVTDKSRNERAATDDHQKKLITNYARQKKF